MVRSSFEICRLCFASFEVWCSAVSIVASGSLIAACGGRTLGDATVANDASRPNVDAEPVEAQNTDGALARSWYCESGTGGVIACDCFANSQGVAFDRCARPLPSCCFMMTADECQCISLFAGIACSPGGGAKPVSTCPPL